ncbi:SusD/RagB family nutrient-binding outer membrane lipoprotein [Adhaeribacter pallidiroseus]|uniref:Starch-binding associating with outer membrane n=1 Tax=Adhaeribacter pallidiroseus TaxID=2072847 RepID=A0A369QQN2_9BACT|nr:SusD/RagB family nutrient-binding outer membrane lipoprotein [Adhaeribacter pallidiroseus]RDC64488.1 hypothetical protein AHMF7616_03102 [Adhaeribacter pallidiroseus]
MKKYIYSVFTLVVLLATPGCKDEFFDINENPNNPTEGSISPQLLLPTTLHVTAGRMATEYDWAAHWMGYWARSGSYGPSLPLENYNITAEYQRTQWTNASTSDQINLTGWYNNLFDINQMETKAAASGQTFYQAIGKTMKSIGFMYLVDEYNNVPYSEAFNINEHILPKYDNGADIYASLLAELDAAATLLASVDVAANPGIETADIMFQGDPVKWRKLVNTQRLKLLIHQSQVVSEATVAAEIAKITADGSGFLMSGETAAVNPGYAPSTGRQNPFWNAYKLTPQGGVADNFNRANNYILDKLASNGDVRYEYYFSEAPTPIQGNLYYGYNFGEILPSSDPYKAVNSSDVAGPGLAKSPTQSQWLFTSVESLFLQAEAIQRGWLPGDPKAAFESAVRESFTWLGVTDAAASADAYLAQENDLVDYDAATDKVRFIATQKYLSLVGINNFEAWVDYRRLGIPSDLPLSLNPGRAGRGIPKRLVYPQDEYSYNAANVGTQGTIDPQTSTVFWDK